VQKLSRWADLPQRFKAIRGKALSACWCWWRRRRWRTCSRPIPYCFREQWKRPVVVWGWGGGGGGWGGGTGSSPRSPDRHRSEAGRRPRQPFPNGFQPGPASSSSARMIVLPASSLAPLLSEFDVSREKSKSAKSAGGLTLPNRTDSTGSFAPPAGYPRRAFFLKKRGPAPRPRAARAIVGEKNRGSNCSVGRVSVENPPSEPGRRHFLTCPANAGPELPASRNRRATRLCPSSRDLAPFSLALTPNIRRGSSPPAPRRRRVQHVERPRRVPSPSPDRAIKQPCPATCLAGIEDLPRVSTSAGPRCFPLSSYLSVCRSAPPIRSNQKVDLTGLVYIKYNKRFQQPC